MYKKVRPTTFDELTMNVFMLVREFDPTTFDFSEGINGSTILASTTGGVTFTDTPEYTDFGDDIDNCPKNTMELKHKEDGDVTLSGTLVTLTPEIMQMLIGAADLDGNKVTPRTTLQQSDFMSELWGIADYGNGGILAIKMKRVLNTSGFSVATTDRAKANIAFTFTCHKTIADVDNPPYEIYILTPESTTAYVVLNTHSATITAGQTKTLTAETAPATATVTWSSGNESVATVAGGVVTAVAKGNTIITATITVDGVAYSDTCTVIVEADTGA